MLVSFLLYGNLQHSLSLTTIPTVHVHVQHLHVYNLLFCLPWLFKDVCIDGEGHLVSTEVRQQQRSLLKHVWREA